MKKIKKYLSKKEYIIFTLAMIIIVLSSFSYAFYYNIENTEENIAKTDCFKLTFQDENDINLDKAYPLSEEEGTNLTPYTFTITNVCNSLEEYQVNIETLNESTLGISELRYMLDNNISNILSNQEEVTTYVNNNIKDSRNIISGTLSKNASVTYNLRLWIDEDSTPDLSANKTFKGKVVILSVPKRFIILNTNGGEITSNLITREVGKQIGELEEPIKLGYSFAGWYKEIELKNQISANTVVTNSMDTIYAKFIANDNTRYLVEHYQMDTTGNYPSTPYESDELYGTSDTNVTPLTKTYTGFTSPITQTVNIDGDGSQVVKYYYSRNKYVQVTQGRYMNTSGSYGSYSNIETKEVYYGATYSYSKSATAEYAAASVASYIVTGAKTNQVSFARNAYTQTTQGRYMNTSGSYGSYSTLETKSVYYGASYSYSRAATAEYNAASVASYTVTAAKTNQINISRRAYTVTYNANGGSVSPTSASIYYNASTTLPTPSKSNSVFMGWYTATTAGSRYNNSITVTGALTMYAQWGTISTTLNSVSGFTNCSAENATCSFSGVQMVCYGSGSTYTCKTLTGSVACNNTTFGDPTPQVAKRCYRAAVSFCSNENSTCSYSGTRTVCYGANSTFTCKRLAGSVACNNTTFVDPLKNVEKRCLLSG